LKKIPLCTIMQSVDANAVFISLPRIILDRIRKEYFFYIVDEEKPVARIMTSFDTQEQDVQDFIHVMKNAIGK